MDCRGGQQRGPAGRQSRRPGRLGASIRTVAPTRTTRTVMRKLSMAFAPSAQRTIQTMRPNVGGEDHAHERPILSGQGRGQPGDHGPSTPASAGVVAPGSAAARTRREPTITPSAPARPPARLLGRRRCRSRPPPAPRVAPARGRRAVSVGQRRALAGRAGDRDRVEEARARCAPISREALVGRRRRDERNQREAGGVAGGATSRLTPRAAGRGRSGPPTPRRGERVGEALGAAREHGFA